jgi:serine/threonine protein kinase
MTACIGTLVYTAPEVWPAAGDDNTSEPVKYDQEADIYALALILHELFGGGASFFPPPKNCHHNQQQILLIQAKSQRKPPLLRLDLIPSVLNDVVKRGVDADPSRRPSLEEFAAAIKKC